MSVSVFAPASVGNVGVGFDILGLAVKPIDGTLLGDVVTVEKASENSLTVIGKFAHKLPSDPQENIIWHCLMLFNQAMKDAGEQVAALIDTVKITLDKKMPVGSGLGSSACSVVAGLEGLNAYYRKYHQFCFSQKDMLLMMGAMEAKISGSLHYDNVAPCYLGGLQLMVPDAQVIARTLPNFADCYYVMAYPGIEVSTKMARDVLPKQYSRTDLITFGQNLATFVDACHRQDKVQAFSQFEDIVAEPYRQNLIPGFTEAKAYLLSQHALVVGISGSGPTLFCVCDKLEQAQTLANWLEVNYLQTINNVSEGFVHVCKADIEGAVEL